MPASNQEEFVSAIVRYSLGAPLLFEPDTYRKGRGVREPADLAWASRDAVFLINMQQSDAPAEVQSEHNLKQFRGWMRMWRSGVNLEGSNDWGNFSLAYIQVSRVVLLSIVDAPDATLQEISDPLSQDPKVRTVFQIPAPALLDLAKRGGSAVDLLDLSLRVTVGDGGASAAEAMLMAREAHESAFARAESATWAELRDESLYREVLNLLARGSRSQIGMSPSSQDLSGDGFINVFNDLDWEATAEIALNLEHCIRAVRDVPVGAYGPTALAAKVEAPPYRFIVGAHDIRNSEEFVAQMAQTVEVMKSEDPDRPPIAMV